MFSHIFCLLNQFYFFIYVWCQIIKVPNEQCNQSDKSWYPVKGKPFEFLYCNTRTKIYEISKCQKINGVQSVFNAATQQCTVTHLSRSPGTPKSSKLGESCIFNTDCYEYMYCPLGKCACLPGYVGVTGICYPGINPEQIGCILDAQCQIVWPGTTCESSTSTCRCSPNPGSPSVPRVALATKDGIVCVAAGSCPLPEGYDTPVSPSILSPFLDLSDAGTRQMCTYLSSDTSAVRDNYCDVTKSLAPSVREYVGDLYDCIPLDVTTTGARPGICCPNKALNCIQPRPATVAGGATGSQRFWYNSATGDCVPFIWDSRQDSPPSANNFISADHCLSYCSNFCSRGSPEYTGVVDRSSLGQPRRCSTTASCTNTGNRRYQCNQVGTSQYCCPSKEWICSNLGGRTYSFGTTAPTSFDVGAGITAVILPITRWYYDTSSKTCISFQYLQFGGNFNNFGSPQECQAFCGVAVCTQGEPLKDSTGNAQSCSSANGCPSTYDCRQSICCPKMQTVCSQPLVRGTCTGSVPKYWYNPTTRDCEYFSYTGCGGNDNNFNSYPACVDYCISFEPEPKCIQGQADKDGTGKFHKCSSSSFQSCRSNFECYYDGQLFGCCPTKLSTCSSQPVAGSVCKLPTNRWYFNPVSKICQTFTFLGCDGNSNNFQTKQQCESYCNSAGCPFGGNPYRDSMTNVISICETRLKPCPLGYDCVLISFGGSNVNHCCPTRANICSQPLVTGAECGSPSQRFYFDPLTKQCQMFYYMGCSGNQNNFVTMQQCNIFCSSIACSVGETVLFNTNTKLPMNCTMQSSADVCGAGYSCKLDSIRNEFYCCGSVLNGVCPTNEKTYSDPCTGLPKECLQTFSNCPPNYLCRTNYQRNKNYCCASSTPTVLCPAGKAVYNDEVTNAPKQCVVTFINTCPFGFSCQTMVSNQFQGYCCSISSICPNNGEFVVDQSTGNPLVCFANGSVAICPANSICLYTPGATNGFCCKTTIPQSGPCPTGLAPLLELNTNLPRQCISDADCLLPGFKCSVFSNQTTNRICCINPGNCPLNLNPLIDSKTGVTVICPTGQSQCNVPGYGCQLGSAGVNVCCSEKSNVTLLCPHGRPLNTLTCSRNGDCPLNYECLKSNGAVKICCPSKRLVCSQNFNSGITCSSMQPTTRYYYSALSGSCQAFTFNGCDGNDNNFVTIGECDTFCATGICSGGSPLRVGSWFKFCNYESCPAGYQCTQPVYGPSIWKICCQTYETVCRLPSSTGIDCVNGAGVDTRFYHNSVTQKCEQFVYLGCSGNGNNFESSDACYYYCRPPTPPPTIMCPNKQSVWIDPITKLAPICIAPYRCPNFYRCTYIFSMNDYYCCGPTTVFSFGCPSGGTPYLYPNLNLPLSCVIGSQCPQGYSCQRSLSANQYYCCPTRRLISDGPNERPKRSLFFDHLNQNSNSCHLSKRMNVFL